MKDSILKDSGFAENIFWKIPSEWFHSERFRFGQKVSSERFLLKDSIMKDSGWVLKYFLKDSFRKIPFCKIPFWKIPFWKIPVLWKRVILKDSILKDSAPPLWVLVNRKRTVINFLTIGLQLFTHYKKLETVNRFYTRFLPLILQVI
jgi:hypothetical protein